MLAVFELVSRVAAFWKRHGVRPTVQRFGVFVKRLFSRSRMILYSYDFPKAGDAGSQFSRLPAHVSVERKRRLNEIDSQDWQKIRNFWNPDLCQRNFTERFGKGASVWLVRCHGALAGYGWTMLGQTIAPHYHPLGGNDVHLFDYLIFPEFRGRNINPLLVNYILHQMAEEGRTRAYIEVKEWNQPQLASLRKTAFQFMGAARKVSLFGRTYVEWSSAGKLLGAANAPMRVEKKSKDGGDRTNPLIV